jgi:hypothetical protein
MQHTCRGAISLENAQIQGDEFNNFVVSNGTNQTFHLRASNEQEKQKWINALEITKKARIGGGMNGTCNNAFFNSLINQNNDSDDDEDTIEAEKNDLENTLNLMQEKLKELNLSQEFVQKHINALNRSLGDLSNLQGKPEDFIIKTINERSGICKIALIGLGTHCQDFIRMAQTQVRKMHRMSELEREHRLKLEEMVQDMAKQQSNIESQLNKRGHNNNNNNSQARRGAKNNTNQAPQPVVGLIQGDSNSKNNNTSGAQKLVGQAVLPSNLNETASERGVGAKPNNSSRGGSSSTSNDHNTTKSSQNQQQSSNLDENDDEFHDAVEEINFSVTLPKKGGAGGVGLHHRNPSSISKLYLQESDETDGEEDEDQQTIKVTMHVNKEEGENNDASQNDQQQVKLASVTTTTATCAKKQLTSSDLSLVAKPRAGPPRRRRTQITTRPNYSLNLWSIMKNCIGKDLSKIPIPVNFSEPLSMLQRVTEDLEYSECLDKAAACDDQWEQMAYVAAFTISSYCNSANRPNKPFNPMLGETYECDRLDDHGWRSLAEQVSHHPPGVAFHAESLKGWKHYQEFIMTSKFRGQYLQIIPLGTAHLEFEKTGHHYTWRKVVTFVRNIIVGKLWIDNVGEMDIINHKTKDVCHLKYFPYSYFSREPPRKVTGIITDSNNIARYVLNGTWTDQIEGAPVLNPQVVTASTQLNTGKSKILWKKKLQP